MKKPRIIAYGLSEGVSGDKGPRQYSREDLDLLMVPLGENTSLLDYDAAILLAGGFEAWPHPDDDLGPYAKCTSDLDRREHEIHALLQTNVPVIFLVPPVKRFFHHRPLPSETDLFRRVLESKEIGWGDFDKKRIPSLPSEVPEFASFMKRYGTASIAFDFRQTPVRFKLIAGLPAHPFAFEVRQKLFFLPCYALTSLDLASRVATEAAKAVLAYRDRLSKETPTWIDDFPFAMEEPLRTKISGQRETLAALEASLEKYKDRKTVLCYQSEPLVENVTELLRDVFGLKITAEDEKIEDASVVDEQDNRLAVIEIKGITGNFKRQHINQVDSHRERLDAKELPGILILNTKIKAADLASKDQPVHKDIIQKACSDNILLIRTLDLLRFADLIDQGKKTQDDFREIILNESGWLRVDGDDVSVRTE